MKSPNENPLLNEILADEELSNARRTSLAGGIQLLRRRRRQTQFTRLAALIVLIASCVSIFVAHQSGPGSTALHHPKRVAVTAKHEPATPVKTITDEELFALFPGRAVALIGQPGHQEFVLLDSRKSP